MHYRVLMPNLVQTLNLRYIVPGNSEQIDLPGNSEQINSSGNSKQNDLPANSEQDNSPAISDHAIQRTPGEHARLDHPTKKTNNDSDLQSGAGSFSSRPAPGATTKEKEEKLKTWRDYFDNNELNEVWSLLYDEEDNAGRVYRRHLEGLLTLEDVAQAVSCQRTGGADKAEQYVLLVKEIDPRLREDLLAVGVAG